MTKMTSENRNKGKMGVAIGIVIFILIMVLLYVFLGIRSLLQIFKWFFIILFILGILGGAFYFVWFLFFKKQKFDVTYVNKQKLLDACHKGYTGVLKGLYLSGDKAHNRVYWGRITGYARISVMYKELVKEFNKKTGEEKVKTIINTKTNEQEQVYQMRSEEQDVFSISHARNFFTKLFEEEDVVRVSPKDHDELVGDVTLYGFSLIPLSEYWFLNNDMLDVSKVDVAIWTEAKRGIMFEMLRDTKEIIDKATGLDSGHQKKIEEKSLYELPVSVGGGQNK